MSSTIDLAPRSATGPGTINDLCHKVTISIRLLRRMGDILGGSEPRGGAFWAVEVFGLRPNGEFDDLVSSAGQPSEQ